MGYERSKSSIFLLEILINILLFSVLCVCSLQFFIKSYQLTENTTTLHQAVSACNSVAAVFQSGDGTTNSIEKHFPTAVTGQGQLYIYLDENYETCDSQNIAYYITVTEKVTAIPSITVTFYKNGEDATYSIDVYHYKQLTPANMLTGGGLNE